MYGPQYNMLQKSFLQYWKVPNSIPRKKVFKTSKSNRSEITGSWLVSLRTQILPQSLKHVSKKDYLTHNLS